jgi:DNA helicase IV
MSIQIPPKTLSKTQIQINALPINQNYIAAGGPGTGKTLLALLRAQKVIEGIRKESNKPPNVLFIVYNRPVQNYLRNNIHKTGMSEDQATTYHSWLYHKIYNKNVKDVQFGKFDYNLEKVAKDLHGILKPKLDHVILDEAQDLPKLLVESLCEITSNFTIFIDDNQMISEEANLLTLNDARSIVGDPYKSFVLLENHRNSQAIIDFAQLFLKPGDIAPRAINTGGRKPVLESYSNTEQYAKRITAYAANNPDQNIAVILPEPYERKLFFNLISKNGGNVDQYIDGKHTPDFDPDSGKIKLFTYKTHKGLEFDSVFLPELDANYFSNETEARRNQFMVAVTRAKQRLFLGTLMNNRKDTFILKKIRENDGIVDSLTLSDSIDTSREQNDFHISNYGSSGWGNNDIPF